MAFLAGIGTVELKSVPADKVRDRSGPNTSLSGSDVLADEAERWNYFFTAGATGWFEAIKEHTFRSTFLELHQEEAEVIVSHWESRQRILAAAAAGAAAAEGEANHAEQLAALSAEAAARLAPLCGRLDAAVRAECAASAAGLAFVKLSTRSPKDSKKALARAEFEYEKRLAAAPQGSALDDNERWKILSEEVTRAGAVATGAAGLELILDSERVFEDLEYALRGPKEEARAAGAEGAEGPRGAEGAQGVEGPARAYGMSLVARAWDPRLTLRSEFRGIAWGGQLTCLCQYFHPLFFPELPELKGSVEADCRELFLRPAVTSAVAGLGGSCIIDFAWLGPGEVIIVELNPFDGVCLGTFPASTGLFLWDNEQDRAIMKGDAPFEMRIRDCPLSAPALKAQCNPDWRRIIYRETEVRP